MRTCSTMWSWRLRLALVITGISYLWAAIELQLEWIRPAFFTFEMQGALSALYMLWNLGATIIVLALVAVDWVESITDREQQFVQCQVLFRGAVVAGLCLSVIPATYLLSRIVWHYAVMARH